MLDGTDRYETKRGMWVAYTVGSYDGGHPLDRSDSMYSGITLFSDELTALRYANDHGLMVVRVEDGQTLEDAYSLRDTQPL